MTHNEEQFSTRRKYSWLWWVLALGASAWLLWMTMRPSGKVMKDLYPVIRATRNFGVSFHVAIDLIGNIVVFMPIGSALTLATKHWRWRNRILCAALVGAVLSLCIELLQMLIPTRVPGIEDWLLNTVGATLGAIVVYLSHTLILGARRKAKEHIKNPDHG